MKYDVILKKSTILSWEIIVWLADAKSEEIWRNLKNLSIPQQGSMYYVVGYQLKIKK